MQTAREQAEALFRGVEVAAMALPDGCDIQMPVLRADVYRELVELADLTIEGLLCLDAYGGGPVVIDGSKWMVNGTCVRVQAETRPATPGDIALPVACRTGPRPTPEEVAAALGVSHG